MMDPDDDSYDSVDAVAAPCHDDEGRAFEPGEDRQTFQKATGYNREVAWNLTPADMLLKKERKSLENEFSPKLEAQGAMLEYLFAEGPHPGCVAARVAALACSLAPDLVNQIPRDELRLMRGESAEAERWRIQKVFSGYMEKSKVRLTVTDHIDRIEGVLRGAIHREAMHGREHVFQRMPLRSLMQRELWETLVEYEEKLEAYHRTLIFLFEAGSHLGRVVRRVYALARIRRADLLLNMSLEEIGKMLDEKRATQSWRIDQIISQFIESAGMKGFRLSWQKPDEAREQYKESAKNNTNRRCGGGRGKRL